jgi:hypothetical protein
MALEGQREAIWFDEEHDNYVCSPAGAAYLLDMGVRQLWRERIETGRLRVAYLPDGDHEVLVPRALVVNKPTR